MLEGTKIYLDLFLLFIFCIYMCTKICLGILFKKMEIKKINAYIPIYNKYVLIKKLQMKNQLFFLTLIPLVNLYYYNIIIKELLKAFGLSDKDSTLYLIVPLYKFPELVFKNPKFILGQYDLTEEFIKNENMIFSKPKQNEVPQEIVNLDIIDNNDINKLEKGPETVFTNQNLEQDKHQVTYVEAEKSVVKEETKPVIRELDKGKPKQCPYCHAWLSPSATTCFLCGHQLQ